MNKEILIKIEEDETGIAIVEGRQLVEIYFQRHAGQRLIGNIYKGIVENVLPGMQAAFVDIGLGKNSFLYVEDALPKKNNEDGSQKPFDQRSINEILHKGQEILVQIFKEPVGTKGARVTTNPTLPGHYLVLLPKGDYIAVSRRIEDNQECQRLKALVAEILPADMGVIIRTVASGVGKEELLADLKFLLKQWKRIQGKAVVGSAPSLIHQDLDLLQRIFRDADDSDIDKVWVDSNESKERVCDIIHDILPGLLEKIFIHSEGDLFEQYNIYGQMEQALRRKVWLKSGGYIIFDQVEALTIVDVNTGKYVGETNLSDTVLKTNMEAVAEIARQLRLRNIGGIVIVDFIDMDGAENKFILMDFLEEQLKKDRTRVTVLGMTQLGLVEMTRKKVGHELGSTLERECPFCYGKGRVMSEETVYLMILRELNKLTEIDDACILLKTNQLVADYLLGPCHKDLKNWEKKWHKKLLIKGLPGLHMSDITVRPCSNEELADYAQPVIKGQLLNLLVEKAYSDRFYSGLAYFHDFPIEIAHGEEYLGQEVKVEISDVFSSHARGIIKQ